MTAILRCGFRYGVDQLGEWHHRWFINSFDHRSQRIQSCLRRWGLSLLVVVSAVVIHMPHAHANETCDTFSFDAGFLNTDETLEDSSVTIIGHLPDHNYVVVVPGRRESLLTEVRQYIPDAFMTSSRLGAYVHAGAFENRSAAEDLSMRLQACDIRSRVVYFRKGRPV